jgi:hypothetical protein
MIPRHPRNHYAQMKSSSSERMHPCDMRRMTTILLTPSYQQTKSFLVEI